MKVLALMIFMAASLSGQSVSIAWDGNDAYYAIYRNTTGASFVEADRLVNCSPLPNAYVDRSVQPGIRYYYAVSACLSTSPPVGESGLSNVVYATIPNIPIPIPNPPTNLRIISVSPSAGAIVPWNKTTKVTILSEGALKQCLFINNL